MPFFYPGNIGWIDLPEDFLPPVHGLFLMPRGDRSPSPACDACVVEPMRVSVSDSPVCVTHRQRESCFLSLLAVAAIKPRNRDSSTYCRAFAMHVRDRPFTHAEIAYAVPYCVLFLVFSFVIKSKARCCMFFVLARHLYAGICRSVVPVKHDGESTALL